MATTTTHCTGWYNISCPRFRAVVKANSVTHALLLAQRRWPFYREHVAADATVNPLTRKAA